MIDLVNTINGFVWSPALVYLCLGAGLYFSIRSRFVQLRGVPEMFRLLLRGRASSMGVSPFQALSMALSNRVGTGNIAGVATAITFGGPGAVFWMWMVAFFGASTASSNPPWRRSTRNAITKVAIAAARPITSTRRWASAGTPMSSPWRR